MGEKKKIDWKKIWAFILTMKVEFAFFCYFAPGTLNNIGLELLPIEKACRINLNYSDPVCSNLNNAVLKELCPEVYDAQTKNPNMTRDDEFLLTLTSMNNLTDSDSDILFDVCTAETDAQALKLDVQDKRSPLGYLALFVIIFAGPLGDKYNCKKMFLLLPSIGELLSVISYLTTSIFKTTVPMQFHLYLETILNSLCGGFSLMLMGIFSILASTTTEEDRTFRFGVFSAFSSGTGIILSPLAKYTFEWLGYVNMFLLCVLIHVVGIIFIIFFIKEGPAPTTDTKPDIKKESPATLNKDTGLDNPGYDTTTEVSTASTLEMRFRNTSEEIATKTMPELPVPVTDEVKKGFVRESIDMFLSNFRVFTVMRPFSGRTLLWVVMTAYGIFSFSNIDVLLLSSFGRVAWGWTTEFALYSSFNTAIGFAGTLIVTYVFVNYFKMGDSLLVIVSVAFRLISRVMYAFLKDIVSIYIAGGIDMFNSAPAVAMRSILSKLVHMDELGRLYTVLSVIETLLGPLAIKAYVQIFTDTLSTFPGAFYFLTVGILIVVILFFVRIRTMMNKFLEKTATNETSPPVTDGNDNIESSKL